MNLIRLSRSFAFLGLSLGLLQGCTGNGNSFGDSTTKQMAPGQFAPVAQNKPSESGGAASAQTGDKSAAVNDIFAKSSGAPANAKGYRIGALDVLDVSVLDVPTLTKNIQVTNNGTITLPLVRTVQAAGRTQEELEQDLTARLSKNFLQNPQVTVSIKEYNSQRITVDGAVQKPGIFPKQGDMSLLQAIAQAQGLTTVSDPTGILVFRQVNGKRLAARFDIRQVRSGKQPDPMLVAGDVVMVDESAARTTLRDIASAMPLTGLFSIVPLL